MLIFQGVRDYKSNALFFWGRPFWMAGCSLLAPSATQNVGDPYKEGGWWDVWGNG